jgi:hypothetical protein
MNRPMKGPDGKEIGPTGRKFDVEFCAVARWADGRRSWRKTSSTTSRRLVRP